MGANVLEVSHLEKSFGRDRILKNVSFEMGFGETVGIVGENGSGKSTLLNILSGLIKPSGGKFALGGTIGFCPQEFLIFETLTVSENFRFFATAYGTHEWEETKDHLLDRFRFSQYQHRLVSQLSGGTKQKLNLSLALLNSPDLFLLDEPYSGLDWETYLHFWDYTEEMRSKGRSILIVSHFIYDTKRCDKLFELKDGVLR
jgi:ABC-type multidrug transport system ATPase subunit